MKKFLIGFTALIMCLSVFAGCAQKGDGDKDGDNGTTQGEQQQKPEEKPQPDWLDLSDETTKKNLSAGGYVGGKMGDFSKYLGTDAYRVVTTADEFIKAVADAKCHYKNVWNEANSTYTQVPADGYTEENFKGTVKVIEIANDLNLGYNVLSSAAKVNTSIVEDFTRKAQAAKTTYAMSDMFTQNGISQIKIENTSDLLVYSKNGAKITHAGIKLTSDNNVAFRNLQFDEMWQWEDSANKAAAKVGDYDAFGWAYFKIAFCGYIWIDHCSFGKSYDGQIDYSNPDYTSNASVNFRAPYGADGNNGLHISWCDFEAGSDDEDGYLYKMMAGIEKEYKEGKNNYLYYNALRDGGISFDEILHGLAIPQKKGFLLGDSGDPYEYNLKINVSFDNCKFENLEDRIPKLRGGNAYFSNCIVDSSEYFAYRTALKAKNAVSMVSAVNGGWKCALVSQGLLCGNGGSILAENCIFKGIENLLKNNDGGDGGPAAAGYKIVNCSYQKGETDEVVTGSSDTAASSFPNSSTSTLKTENFSWHTENNTQPFTVIATPLSDLDELLNNDDYGAGTTDKFGNKLLKSDYTK